MTTYYMQSRFMDEPIGYAHHAPPMQKRPIPMSLEKSKGLGMVIGIVAGVVTAGAGWGMYATATSLGGQLAGGAMMAGGAMSAVGAATGNKKLSKVGGILSLAGGAYGMAFDSAGNFALGDKFGGTSLLSEGSAKAMSKFSEVFSGKASSLGNGVTGGNVSSTNPSLTLGETGGSALSGAGGVGETTASTLTGTGAQPSGGLIGNSIGAGPQSTIALNSPSVGTAGTSDMLGGGLNMASKGASGISGTISTASPTLASAGTTATGTASQIAGSGTAGQSQGILGKAMDFAKSPGGSNLVGNALKAFGGDDAESKAAAEANALRARQLDMMQLTDEYRRNPGAVVYDPNDPNAAKIQQAAQAAGVQTIALSVNMNANTLSPMKAFNQQPQGAKA